MATNLAQARRNRYGARNTNDGAAEDSPSQYYNANGSRSGARINGAVRRKTMMGGSSSGPISMRANRSESMEQEADAAMERDHRRGILRARQERNETAQAVHGSRQATGYDVPVGGASKPAGYWKEGRSAGSQVYVPGSPPAAATADKSSQDTTPAQRALMLARRVWKSQGDMKAKQDRNFSRQRADMERNPEQYPASTARKMTTGTAALREEARKRGDLDKY